MPDLNCGPQVFPPVFNPPKLIGLGELEQLVESAFVRASFSSNGAGEPRAVRELPAATLAAAQVPSLEALVYRAFLRASFASSTEDEKEAARRTR